MSELAQFFGLRLLPVLVVFGYVSNLANANQHVTTALDLEPVSSERGLAGEPWPEESVRAELTRLQEQTGLSLVWVADGAVQVVLFSHRPMLEANGLPVRANSLPDGAGPGKMSPDGTEVAFGFRPGRSGPVRLGISRTDGSELREYPNLQYEKVWEDKCWSYDKSMLATRVGKMEGAQDRNPSLHLLNVSSGETQEIEGQGLITSPCWSPDDKQFVYEAADSVRVFDIKEKSSRQIAEGTNPTWSPDGNWIAFLDHDTYYVIHPSGTQRHVLFKSWHSASGLSWSPDSRFVAYVSQARTLEGGFLHSDVLTYFLRVRRVEDNSEARISYALTPFSYQWVASTKLFRAAQSNIGQPPSLRPEFAGKVFLVGQVAKQGWYPLESSGTILQVLAAAGGLTLSAKADSIYITRTENKKQVRILFHYKKAQQGGEKDILLQSGDVVVVP